MTGAVGEGNASGERTAYAASDWTAEGLLALKGDRTISVVIPAKNEEATVGDVAEPHPRRPG